LQVLLHCNPAFERILHVSVSEPPPNGKAAFERTPQKPVALSVIADNIAPCLRELQQWVAWEYVLKKDGDGNPYWTKILKDVYTGRNAKSNDPSTWTAFDDALAYYQAHRSTISGIGFVFSADDPFCGIDLDDGRDRDTGEILPWAASLIQEMNSYTEVSPSGTGAKIFVRATLPPKAKHCKPFKGGKIEVYDSLRYFAVTGHSLSSAPATVEPRQGEVDEFYRVVFAEAETPPDPFEVTATGTIPDDDTSLIQKAMSAKNGEKFSRLWNGDTSDYGNDDSRADLALCGLLAFWTGPDAVRIDRLFRQSKLMRPKWDEKRGGGTYGQHTIERALQDRTEFRGGQSQPGWPDPIPLGETPNVPGFPVEVLPGPMRGLVEEIAWAMNCPTDFAAVPLLTIAGGALGNSRHLAIARTHTQPPLLYTGIIAPPGTVKSPVLKLLRRPLDRVQQRYLDDWHAQMEAWGEAEQEDRGPKPILKRCIVSDVTTESLGIILCENPRGVVMVRDELVGLIAGMNQYKAGKGHDRQVYLALWSGDTIVIDRKSDKDRQGAPLYVADPFTAIVGCLQPAVLDRLRGEPVRGVPPPDDGFLDRFLLVYPADMRAAGERWRDVAQQRLDGWQDTVERLLALHMVDQDGDQPRPHFVRLTTCGRDAWQRFTQADADEINGADFPPHLRGPWSKLRGYAARLALIVHYLRRASGEMTGDDVDGESMDRAAKLVAYFKAHARKVYAVMDADPRIAEARKVFRWIVARRLRRFQKRDAFQSLKGTFRTVEALDPVLSLLEKHALIRPELTPDPTGRGRKPSPFYEVHPRLHQLDPHNSHNSQNWPSDPNSGNCGNCEDHSGGNESSPATGEHHSRDHDVEGSGVPQEGEL
jgi:hypothetical protein